MSLDRAIPIPAKPNAGDPIRAATIGDLIEGVDRLAHRAQVPVLYRRDPIRKPSSSSSGRAEFRVFRGAVPNRLNIEPGSIVRLLFGEDAVRLELPEFPTIDDVPCNELQGTDGQDGYPTFDLTGFTADTDYFVALVATRSKSKLVVGLDADPDLIPAPGKLIRRIARVQFEADDDELLIPKEIDQLWIGSMELRFENAPPFHLELITDTSGESPVYKVAVHPGRVYERIIPGTESLSPHVPTNLLGSDGLPIQHPISVGQQVSVIVQVMVNGEIGADSDPVTIAIESAGASSTHFVPICADDTEGSPGVYHYELGRLLAGAGEGDPPVLKPCYTGSHIDHWRDITLLENTINPSTEGLARLIQKWDPDLGKYLLRAISKGDGQLRVDEEEGVIKVRGNGNAGSLSILNCSGSEVARLDWEDGLILTTGELSITAGCPSSETPP